jgi:hypothetical protein
MASYLGFWWHPEYRVVEVPRAFGQSLYRAIVRIKANRSSVITHECEVVASTMEMAVHRVAYVCCTVLRSEYACFDNSQFQYVPRGGIGPSGSHVTICRYPENEENQLVQRTAELVYCGEAMSRALFLELATCRDQLHRALSHLAAYTTEFVGDASYSGFELPRYSQLPDVGGYTPARGALITINPCHTVPLEYGLQADALCFDTDCVPLPLEQFQPDRRGTHDRYVTQYRPQ